MITLHYHPLASYCWKVLIGLYETEIPFAPNLVDLGDPAQRDALARLWPFAKFPVLRDDERGRTVAESTTILEYLACRHPGRVTLVPAAPEAAFEARAMDRLFDLYVHEPMQRLVDDRLRPDAARDALGVSRARATLETAYALLERTLKDRAFAAGDAFTIADCAAAPALHYANIVLPFSKEHSRLRAYLDELYERPSFARVLAEAAPYAHLFPAAR
jgi:glutathione S-transferase